MRLRCRVSNRPASECEHCCYDSGEGDWGKTLARMLDEWETDRRDLWRRALESRPKRPGRKPKLRLVSCRA